MNRSKILSKPKQTALIAACIASLGWSCTSQAIDLGNGFGLDVTLTAMSDYRDNGISQTNGDPALQAEAVVQHESGIYVGIFTSNVDFGTKAYREDMYYAGITLPFSEEIYLDTYIGRYEYPNEAYSDVNEYYAELGAYGFILAYTLNFDQRGHQPNSSNVSIGYSYELPYETVLRARYGHADVRVDAFWSNSGDSRQTFYDWDVTLAKNVAGVDVFASYIDTDLSEAECYSATGFDDICSATVVFGVSKTF